MTASRVSSHLMRGHIIRLFSGILGVLRVFHTNNGGTLAGQLGRACVHQLSALLNGVPVTVRLLAF